MNYKSDLRVDAARAKSMQKVVDRLQIEGLRRMSGELTGPCPIVGGDDGFNINVNKGVFICRQCGDRGDPIQLVMHVMGCDFMGAIEYLEGTEPVELTPAEIAERTAAQAKKKKEQDKKQENYRAYAKRRAVDVWRSAVPIWGTPAEAYLRARGIKLDELGYAFKCFRFIQSHPYKKKLDKRTHTLLTGPALISGIAGPRGTLEAVHQTWIDLSNKNGKAEIKHPDNGKLLPAKMVQGSKKGNAIRLTGDHISTTLIMGEGIETTLSVLQANADHGAACWAGVDLGNMAGLMERVPKIKHSGIPKMDDADAFVPPDYTRRLIFVMDGDSEPKMTRAKLESGLKRAMAKIPGLVGQIVPVETGKDLNDILQDDDE